jgi:exopolyphosphatase/guanosine-5'-triphosphate,3'-diphosphate pyrophosphatase
MSLLAMAASSWWTESESRPAFSKSGRFLVGWKRFTIHDGAMSLDVSPTKLDDSSAGSQPRLLAVIDIGATSVRMAIAEMQPDGTLRVLERLTQAIRLGADSFVKGYIAKSTIEDCVDVLKIYRAKLEEYGIRSPEQIRVVATSAVREASNRLAFQDRIYIATGFTIEPFDEAELHRVTFMGIQPILEARPELRQGQTIVCEIGGGSTELLVFEEGQVAFSRTYRLGALRLRKTLEVFQPPLDKLQRVMQTQIEQTVDQIVEVVGTAPSRRLVAMGSDMRLAATQLGAHDNELLASVNVADLRKLTAKILDQNVDRLVRQWHISIPDAETLGPALLANLMIAEGLGVDTVLVAKSNLRDGLLAEMAAGRKLAGSIADHVIRSAISLGRKFHTDEAHARHVARLAGQLFDQLGSLHALPPRYGIILHLAALLHEVGMFLGTRSHHKHSLYIIRNSEFFGIGQKDLMLVALVARYHRRATPQPNHEGYATLDRDDRVAVAKLAAILRVAKALDASRNQAIGDITCQLKGTQLEIIVGHVADLSLEQLELRQKRSLFKDVFGLDVTLRSRPSGDDQP